MMRILAEIVGWFVMAMFVYHAVEGWIGIVRMVSECAGGGCP